MKTSIHNTKGILRTWKHTEGEFLSTKTLSVVIWLYFYMEWLSLVMNFNKYFIQNPYIRKEGL